jgi:AhpD family alkylhydroperoxidase
MIRIDLDESASAFSKAMSHLDNAMVRVADEAGLEPAIRELVRARASQLNGCAYCVDMHTKDALAGGETDQRLYALPVWRETPFFTDRERAALEFTEVVTRLTETHVPDEAYQAVAKHFSEAEMGALISLIVTINAWNMIGVSTRAWEPGSYKP